MVYWPSIRYRFNDQFPNTSDIALFDSSIEALVSSTHAGRLWQRFLLTMSKHALQLTWELQCNDFVDGLTAQPIKTGVSSFADLFYLAAAVPLGVVHTVVCSPGPPPVVLFLYPALSYS
jgi:hypothetical protein